MKYVVKFLAGCAILIASIGWVSATGVQSEYDMDEDDDLYVPPELRIKVTEDLSQLAQQSRDYEVPILILFSTEDCYYCVRLINEVLGPLKLSGIDPDKIIMRKVLLENFEMLNDFQGNEVSGEDFAMRHDVDVIPTIAIINAQGVDLVPKIIGYQTPGIYDAYLKKSIQVSRHLMWLEETD